MRVLVSGGGTGGHIYPALSLMNYLKEQDPSTEFLYVGTERGLESTTFLKRDMILKRLRFKESFGFIVTRKLQDIMVFLYKLF